MPRTFGDAQIHISHFDYAVNVDSPLPDHAGKPPSAEEIQIGKLIAENLVEDGATLQMGNYQCKLSHNILCKSSMPMFQSFISAILLQALATFQTLSLTSLAIIKIWVYIQKCSVVD